MKEEMFSDKSETAAESITDAEWQVAKVLWGRSPLSASEIISEIRPATGWNPKTIHTLIRRLVQKKIIAAREGISPFSYYPLISEQECAREKTRTLIDKLYDGSFNLMVARFVKEKSLSPEEIAELREILDRG